MTENEGHRGKFIVIYGMNNIGKSTQAKKVVDYLKEKGLQVEYLKYPVYDTPTGHEINTILRSDAKQELSEEEFQSLYYENRKEFQPNLLKKLEQGITIVSEDYTGTGLVWGSVKGASLDWLKKLNEDLLVEDLAILLDGERFLQGKEEKHLHEANDDFMRAARVKHLELAREFDWKVVPANRRVKEVFGDVQKIVDELIP
jgi:dTMP kinase